MAMKQAKRRLDRENMLRKKDERNDQRRNEGLSRGDDAEAIRKERRDRREDWELGPLAPRRDVGDMKNHYGALPGTRLDGYEIMTKAEREKRLAPWGWRVALREGDRVVVINGRDKGSIGKVKEVDEKKLEAQVEGLNMVCSYGLWMISSFDLFDTG